jgi:hypothetical protein
MLISLSLGVMSISWGSGDVFLALGRSGTLIKLELPATALMITAFLFAAQYGLIGVASVHLIFNILHCTARMILVRHITKVTGRSLLLAIAPAVLVSMTTAAVGFGTSTLLPRGELSSLLILSTVCAMTVVGTALLFARPAVVEVIEMVGLHRRRSATIPADPGPA